MDEWLESAYEDTFYYEGDESEIFDEDDDIEEYRCEADIKNGVCQYVLNANGTCRNVKNHVYDDELGEIEYFNPHNRPLHLPQVHSGTIAEASGMTLI